MSFPAYPEYKDSGVPWLGEVPAHWDVVPLGRMGRFSASGIDKLHVEGQPLTRMVNYTDIYANARAEIVQGEHLMVTSTTEDKLHEHTLSDGDFLFTPSSETADDIGHVAVFRASAGPAVFSYHLTRYQSKRVDPDFGRFALNAAYVRRQFILKARGTTRQILGRNDFNSTVISVPDLQEQAVIAAFLDQETAKIDALVAEQERLIALLKEKRQAVISHAVTKGLNPHAPMKHSGIEWLGEIPAHWMAGKLKHVATVKGRIGFRGYTAEDLVAEGEGALVLGGSNMGSDNTLTLEKRTYVSWQKYHESPEIMVFEGDVIVGQRGTCGSAVLIDSDLGPTTINPSLVVLKNLRTSAAFLAHSINADHAQSVVASILSKTAVPMISQEQIGNLPIALPPKEEQEAISEFLAQNCGRIDRLIDDAQQGTALLQERRAALISAAVTGKIDVRGLVDAPAEREVA